MVDQLITPIGTQYKRVLTKITSFRNVLSIVFYGFHLDIDDILQWNAKGIPVR